MITELFLGLILDFVNTILSPLSVVNYAITNIMNVSWFTGIISVIAYIMPWNYITPILYLSLAFIWVKIVIAVIRFVKSFLPTFGGM